MTMMSPPVAVAYSGCSSLICRNRDCSSDSVDSRATSVTVTTGSSFTSAGLARSLNVLCKAVRPLVA